MQRKIDPHSRRVLWLFILICILLANDFVFKQTFHNYLTGKLSDFVGLAAVALFALLLAPGIGLLSLSLIGATFIWWKSSLSSGFIDFANHYLPFSIGRVVDPEDLMALCVLPVTYVLFRERTPWRPKRLWEWSVAVLSVFAFAATEETIPTDFRYSVEYVFQMPAESLKASIRQFPGPTVLRQESELYFSIWIPWRCSFGLNASTRLLPREPGSRLILDRLWSDCDPAGSHSSQLLLLFEDSVVARLRQVDSRF